MIDSLAVRALHGQPHSSRHFDVFTAKSTAAALQDSIGPFQLGYIARTIVAHNFTADWYYIPAAMSYIPPHTVGMVLPINGTEIAYAVPECPLQYTVGSRVVGATFSLLYSELQLPPSDGFVVSAGPPPPQSPGGVATGLAIWLKADAL